MYKKLLTLIFFVSISFSGFAQVTVTGKLIDVKTRQSLSGATITSNRVSIVTDNKGEFLFQLTPGKHRFVVTFEYYKTIDTTLNVMPGIPVLLMMSEELNVVKEVEINTGYQSIPKTRSTGSFSTVSSKLLSEQVQTGLIEKLEGITSSYVIDRKSNGGKLNGGMIRGLSTIRGPREPLIILDNFPYEGNLGNLNPNDVESITILKDAAAASIWGVRAGNGVIVITTKRALFNQPLKISVTANARIDERPNLYYLPNMSVSEHIDVENMLFDKGYYTSLENSFAKTPLSEVVEIRIAERDKLITKQQAADQIDMLRNYDLRKQSNKYLYNNALSQQYSVQLGAGNQNSSWVILGGYDHKISSVSAPFDRYNLHATLNQNITKKLMVTGSLNYTHSLQKTGKPEYSSLDISSGSMPLYTRLANDDGESLPVISNYRLKFLNTLGNGKLLDWNFYPLEDYKHEDNSTRINSTVATISGKYKVLDWLNLSGTYQLERQQVTAESFYTSESYFVRNIVNNFSQIDANGMVKRIVPLGAFKKVNENQLYSQNGRVQIDVSKTAGKSDFSALAGFEIRDKIANESQHANYGINENTHSVSTIDYATPYPSFIYGSSSNIPNYDNLGQTDNRFVSIYMNGAYTYDSRYTISASARRDASNLFGLSANRKWNPLFSTGLAWNISEEDFYGLKSIPYLKLRTTFGVSGNTNPNASALLTIFYFSDNSAYTKTPYASISNYANPDLRWERVFMFNTGLDFKTKDNRLTGTIEFYKKRSVDLITTTPIDPTAGVGLSILRNAGIFNTSGFDVELNSENTRGKLKWSTSLLMSFTKDKIVKNYLPSRNVSSMLNGNIVYTAIEGYPLYGMFSYKWAGLSPSNGEPLGLIDGTTSNNYSLLTGNGVKIKDLTYHGSALPTKTGSIGNTLSYQGISLSVRVNYKFGYYFRKRSINYHELFSRRVGHSDYSLRWKNPGDELTTTIPSSYYPTSTSREAFYALSEVNVEKGDHIRLQYINLAYTFPKKSFGQFLKNTQVFAVASNLGILWRANHSGADPDYPSIPSSKNIAFGVKSNF